jgi:hypothetical protein
LSLLLKIHRISTANCAGFTPSQYKTGGVFRDYIQVRLKLSQSNYSSLTPFQLAGIEVDGNVLAAYHHAVDTPCQDSFGRCS